MAKLKLGILISGRGSNMAALAAACAGADFPAEVALVLSNNAAAGGLAIARQAGIATAVIDHRGFEDRNAFDAALDAGLTDAGVRLVSEDLRADLDTERYINGGQVLVKMVIGRDNYTPLHYHATVEAFLTLIRGRKRVTLFPASQVMSAARNSPG